MPDSVKVLLDQNIPIVVADWLRQKRPVWTVYHVSEVGLHGKSDRDIYQWGIAQKAIIITFDEDFADQRSFPVGSHYGIVRLRIWPTTIEETKVALGRLFEEVSDSELLGALVIIDQSRIRVRKATRTDLD